MSTAPTLGPIVMTVNDYRNDYRIAIGLTDAERTAPLFGKSRPRRIAPKLGLAYENRIGKELKKHHEKERFLEFEHNPWFRFYDTFGTGHCSPDYLIHFPQGVVVVEVKLTWVEIAQDKLNDLYMPVVSLALDRPVRSLVIVKNLTPQAPPSSPSIMSALRKKTNLVHWPMIGPLLWE